ncbi:hypothetical protein AJ79_02924 [Helicocarpus griseus UAMH5409]|uniref:Methyltransferase domain-containing protein n=1 Tax=Helicocarpus griseus UAMH5409 TaxID=1447875 RepID=A0A2B7Y0A2_9EURO|nr:hypothetical protein AJ79_02924 [Helicocarpus griseus UAMH5409]
MSSSNKPSNTTSAILATPGSLAAANEEFFSNSADALFKDKWVQDMQAQMREFLEKNIEWLGITGAPGDEDREKKMLDYACGNGFLTRIYHPHFTKCIGIDIAPGMIEKYNEAAVQLGLAPEQMYGFVGDLSAPSIKDAADENNPFSTLPSDFDFAAIAMSLHHMEDPSATLIKLSERVRRGGIVLAIDWLASPSSSSEQSTDAQGQHTHHHHHHHGHHHGHDNSPGNTDDKASTAGHHAHDHPASHTVSHAHASFSRAQVEEMFVRAGLEEVDVLVSEWEVAPPEGRVLPNKGATRLFFARGRKM